MNLTNPAILFMPALETRFLQKASIIAPTLGAICIDLEDSIVERCKTQARESLEQAKSLLQAIVAANDKMQIYVRVNNQRTAEYTKDLCLFSALRSQGLVHGLLYPKLESVSELACLYSDLDGMDTCRIAAIETLKGALRFREIVASEYRLDGVVVGGEDLCADMNVDRPPVFYHNPLLSHIAAEIAIIAQSVTTSFIGNIWPYLQIPELIPCFQEEVLTDVQYGAIGKFVFHPTQVEVVNGLFAKSFRMQSRKASLGDRLSAIRGRAESSGLAVAVSKGRMVDMPEFARVKLHFGYDDTLNRLANWDV